MKKTIEITIDGITSEITFTKVTAFNPEDNKRMEAVLVHDSLDEFGDGDGVVFDGTIPENEEDALAFLENEYINTDFSIMATVIEPKWYAVLKDNEDNDWGTGSYDLEEAKQMVKKSKQFYPDAFIAVIEEGNDPICVEEIKEF